MKKPIGLIIVIAVIGAIAIGVFYYTGKGVETAPVVGSTDFKNATYIINNQTVTLANGKSETSGTTYFGNEATGDLNGDGLQDVAFVVTQDGGGSGTFYYAVVALREADGYKGLNAILLGDRIAPQNTEIKDGRVIVNYADRKPTDPMTTEPSLGVTKYLKVDGNTLVEVQPVVSAPTMTVPADYTVDNAYTYQALGPGKDIKGVKYTIPESLTKGTNLSTDSYMSLEQIPNASECTANLFLSSGSNATTTTDAGVTYSFATSSDAAAGNRYDETVYAFPGTNPCVAVRYFIHYGNIQNYPAGSVKEFDKKVLVAQFDVIRRTVVVK